MERILTQFLQLLELMVLASREKQAASLALVQFLFQSFSLRQVLASQLMVRMAESHSLLKFSEVSQVAISVVILLKLW